MSNMSYCRFQNTASDLKDCLEHLCEDLGLDEAKARVRLMKLCEDILNSYGIEDAEADLEQLKADNSQFGVGA